MKPTPRAKAIRDLLRDSAQLLTAPEIAKHFPEVGYTLITGTLYQLVLRGEISRTNLQPKRYGAVTGASAEVSTMATPEAEVSQLFSRNRKLIPVKEAFEMRGAQLLSEIEHQIMMDLYAGLVVTAIMRRHRCSHNTFSTHRSSAIKKLTLYTSQERR